MYFTEPICTRLKRLLSLSDAVRRSNARADGWDDAFRGKGEDESANSVVCVCVCSSPIPDKLNLRLGCSTLLCLSSHRALCSGSQPASGMASEPARPPPLPPPTNVLAQPFPLPPLHLQLPFTSSSPSFGSNSLHRFLTSTLSSGLFFFFLQSSGGIVGLRVQTRASGFP